MGWCGNWRLFSQLALPLSNIYGTQTLSTYTPNSYAYTHTHTCSHSHTHTLHTFTYTHAHTHHSSLILRGWPWQLGGQHYQDHWLWTGSWDWAHYTHERCRHLPMDGPRGHKVIWLLKEIRCLEVWQFQINVCVREEWFAYVCPVGSFGLWGDKFLEKTSMNIVFVALLHLTEIPSFLSYVPWALFLSQDCCHFISLPLSLSLSPFFLPLALVLYYGSFSLERDLTILSTCLWLPMVLVTVLWVSPSQTAVLSLWPLYSMVSWHPYTRCCHWSFSINITISIYNSEVHIDLWYYIDLEGSFWSIDVSVAQRFHTDRRVELCMQRCVNYYMSKGEPFNLVKLVSCVYV